MISGNCTETCSNKRYTRNRNKKGRDVVLYNCQFTHEKLQKMRRQSELCRTDTAVTELRHMHTNNNPKMDANEKRHSCSPNGPERMKDLIETR